jgi:hypothetical protein
VDVTLVLPRPLRLPLLFIGLGCVFALGCSSPSLPVTTQVNVEGTSCADSVRSMSFDVVSSNSLLPGAFVFGSANVVPVPTVTTPNSQTLHIATDLTNVNSGDAVSMIFQAAAYPNASISIQNMMWYTVPKAQQPASPACPPDHGPVIGTADTPGLGFHLEVSNPSPDPIVLPNGIEMAQTPTLYPPAELRRGGANEACSWTVACPAGIVIAPGSPPMMFDLPDAPDPSTQGVLLRYTSSEGGHEHYVVLQVDLTGETVKTEPTTWGAVKALYREQK